MKPQPNKKQGLRVSKLLATGFALLLIILAAGWILYPRFHVQEYASFTRPDGHYRVVVLRSSVWPALMPGQASDAPGKVQLYDRDDKLLQETQVEMVQLVNDVEWGDKKVRIKLVAEWDLPD